MGVSLPNNFRRWAGRRTIRWPSTSGRPCAAARSAHLHGSVACSCISEKFSGIVRAHSTSRTEVLLTGPLKKTLHTEICSAIDDDTSWPTSLKSYVKSRVHLIAQRTLSVRTVLATAQLSDLPSDIVHRQSPETCPCQRWINLPRVGRLHGHAFFRNPEVLANVLPPNCKCDSSVFSQNVKNATVPAYKSFKDTLLSSLKQLSGSLPDTRARVTRGIATRIADLCENNYNRFAASFPRHVYAPYLAKQARRLPPDISVGVFDKAPTLAHFACPLAWHHVFQSLFHASPRFAELITFGHPLDARCWLFWQLCDSLSIALTGNYCGFSVFRRCTPLSDGESGKAFKAYVTYPPSLAVKRALQPLLDSGCRKIKSAGPTTCMLEAPGAPPTYPLLRAASLRSASDNIPFFGDANPPDPEPPPHPDTNPQRRSQRRTRASTPVSTRRRAQPASRVRSSRRWRSIFTDHDLLADTVTREISSAIHLTANTPHPPAPHNPRSPHPIPPPKRALLSHVQSLTTPPPHTPALTTYTQCAQLAPSPKHAVRFGVPDARVLIKHKYLEHQPQAKVKVREVIRHGSHHFKSLARKMSRCISVLWKFVTSHPSSIEVLAMHDIKGFVEKLRKQT